MSRSLLKGKPGAPVVRDVARALGCLLLLALVAAMPGFIASHRGSAETPFSIRIVDPPDDGVVAGRTTIRAEAKGGNGDEHVNFYIDGRLVFTDMALPYEYPWDAGTAPRSRTIKVIAVTSDGRRSEHTVRTRGIDTTEEVQVRLRQISITVLDEKGDFVKNLDRDDFVVEEDGIRRTITHFYKGDAPLSLVLLVDVSKSMLTGLRIEKSKKAAVEFLKALKPNDSVLLIPFNHSVFSVGDFTTDKTRLIRFTEGLVASGGTALYDTLIAGSRKIEEREGRKVIVVFSDGRDEHSIASLPDATDALLRGDNSLYAVGLGLLGVEDGQKKILEDWAKQTGGRAFFTNRVDEVSGFYAAISEELRWQYSIGYPPTKSRRSWHDIKIEVPGRPNLRLRYRTGYLSD